LSVYLVYGTDVTVKGVLAKGNFDQMKAEVENLSKFAKVFVSTKDSASFSNLFGKNVQHLNSKLFSLPDNILGKLIGSGLFSLIGILSIIRHSKEVDVVVSQGTIALQGGFAHLILRKPHVLFLQYFAFKEQLLLKRYLLSSLFKLVELFVIRGSSIVIAPNEKLKEEALAYGAKAVNIIPNFIETKKIDQIASKSCLRKKFGFSTNTKVLLFVGRLHPVKNVDLILKSFARLKEPKNCILIVIGDGPEKQRLMDLALSLGIDKRVRFEGFKSKNEVLEYMKAADLLVLASIVEGQPRVILESWACQLPVVASRVTGITNLVTDRYDGLLFDLPSEEQFCEAISSVFETDISKTIVTNANKNMNLYSEENVLFGQEIAVKNFLSKGQNAES
jgi:glycosyltransferase involved in cell wall biosynthesis